MDLANARKFIDSVSDKYKTIREVTEVKNAIKNNEQARDIVMSDHFKTLREPLIEQQKQSDEKQDKVIQQLKENQLALTSGFKDLVETNKDILTLNKELPFAGEQQPAIPAPSPDEVITAKPNNMFTESELEFLKKSFNEPNDLLKMSEEQLVTAYNEAKDENKSVGIKIGGLKRRKPKTEDEKQQLDYDLKTYERTRDIMEVDIGEGFWHILTCAPCNRKFKRKIVISYFQLKLSKSKNHPRTAPKSTQKLFLI